jgi:hypothetical protein
MALTPEHLQTARELAQLFSYNEIVCREYTGGLNIVTLEPVQACPSHENPLDSLFGLMVKALIAGD